MTTHKKEKHPEKQRPRASPNLDSHCIDDDDIEYCFTCKHFVYKGTYGGALAFICNAPKWHCHRKGQKRKLKGA